MVQRVIDPSILRPETSSQFFDYERHPAPAPVDELVEHFWTVVWDLEPGESYAAQTLPYPSVNLSVTNTEADVTGLIRRSYHRKLTGAGYAIGARFRPGCFRPLVDWPVSLLTDRHRSISEVLGRDTSRLRAVVAATEGIQDRGARGVSPRELTQPRVALLADFLGERWPAPDPTAQWVADLVALIAGDREVLRVAQVSAQAGVTTRTLQRIFADYVGAGPKWVIQRCRLQDAAAQVASRPDLDWADLAQQLGFADQAHLTRAFTATIGTSPAAYARQVRE